VVPCDPIGVETVEGDTVGAADPLKGRAESTVAFYGDDSDLLALYPFDELFQLLVSDSKVAVGRFPSALLQQGTLMIAGSRIDTDDTHRCHTFDLLINDRVISLFPWHACKQRLPASGRHRFYVHYEKALWSRHHSRLGRSDNAYQYRRRSAEGVLRFLQVVIPPRRPEGACCQASRFGRRARLLLFALLVVSEVITYRCGVMPQIEDSLDDNHVVLNEVVDRIWKSPGQEPIISECLLVYAGVE